LGQGRQAGPRIADRQGAIDRGLRRAAATATNRLKYFYAAVGARALATAAKGFGADIAVAVVAPNVGYRIPENCIF
jgi:hypothetical protein